MDTDTAAVLIAPDGSEVVMEVASGTSTYSMPGFAGESIGVFRVEPRGNYTLKAWAPDGEVHAPYTVAVGGNPLGDVGTILALFGGVCCGGATVVAGIVLAGILLIRGGHANPY